MRVVKRLVILGIAVLCIYLAAVSGGLDIILGQLGLADGDGTVIKNSISALADDDDSDEAEAGPGPEPQESSPQPSDADAPEIRPTTISGGLVIKNSSTISVDAAELLAEGCSIKLAAGQPQVLIIHTHSSEAYTPAGLDRYEASGTSRTQDANYNVIRIGNELTALLEGYGLNVIHDTGVYDYPSYNGSYNRSGAAVERYLAEYPSIAIVIDLHRDALGTDEVVYKTVADETGVCASQLMLFVGTNASGLEHPNWRENLKFALYLQNAVVEKHPTVMRPVQLVSYRYNQHLTSGSLILEVGSNGNTLQEALAAIRLFADSAGPAMTKLIE